MSIGMSLRGSFYNTSKRSETMSAFVNHALCEPCWKQREGARTPVRVKGQKETCCWCGKLTTAGIYQRLAWDVCPKGNHSDVA